MPLLRRLQRSVNLKTAILLSGLLLFILYSFSGRSQDHVVLAGSPLFANLKATKHHQPSLAEAQAACDAHNFTTWRKPGRKVYDLVLLSTELDWLEVRLHTLAPHVDYFVVVESPTTFTGKLKPLYLQDNIDRFADYQHKIIHRVVKDEISSQRLWDHEAFFRNALLKSVFPSLIGTEMEAKKGDVLIVSDIDEIIRPETAQILRYCDTPARLTLRSQFFYFAYQWRHRGEQWPHPQATSFGASVQSTLLPEALRMDLMDSGWSLFASYRRWRDRATLWNAGWHCSFCFSTIAEVQSKMASFSHQGWNTPENRDPATIIHRFRHGLDPFNRTGEYYDYINPVYDVPEYVMLQNWRAERFGYMLERTMSQYGEFADGEAMLAGSKAQPPNLSS